MGRRALVGSVSHALSASQLDQVGQSADSVQSGGAEPGSGQLCDYGSTYCDGNSDDEPKLRNLHDARPASQYLQKPCCDPI